MGKVVEKEEQYKEVQSALDIINREQTKRNKTEDVKYILNKSRNSKAPRKDDVQY